MPKTSPFITMQLIADILSFRENQKELSDHIKHSNIDWDAVVIFASRHLMLPALYCRLKTKSLLALIPEDLTTYLKEITAINRGRNEKLLKEAQEISELFQKANIQHVFIKGIALIAGQTFKDSAERMIGDMDILVANKHLQKAFDILTVNGYVSKPISSDYQKETFRHLPRQISPLKFGAIELHSEILIRKYSHLISTEHVLRNTRTKNGISITSIDDSAKITILALQINDRASILGNLKFKTIYDCLALNITNNQTLFNELCIEKHTLAFLSISSSFFKELTPKLSTNFSKFLKHYFLFRLDYPKVGRVMYEIVNVTTTSFRHVVQFINIKSFRRYVFKNKF